MHILAPIYTFLFFTLISSQDYHVKDFNATGDGVADDTNAVRAALASAAKSNGGRVIFDPGYTFRTGCAEISSNVILDVQGMILGFNDSDHYTFPGINSKSSWESLIFGSNINNITITGGGVVDGQGLIWWQCVADCNKAPCLNKDRPKLINLIDATNIVVHNITLQNSPMFNLALQSTSNVHIYNITILNPDSFLKTNPSHNTDGINMDGVQNVLIENCHISTGNRFLGASDAQRNLLTSDDAIAIDSSCKGPSSKDLLIRNLTVGTAHGLSIGSGTCGNVSNVTFQDITMNGAWIGVRIKSQVDRGGLVTNVTYKNINLYNMQYCIRLTMNYTGTPFNGTGNHVPRFTNINVHDIYCENTIHGWHLDGLDFSEINANFWNIQIKNYTNDLAPVCTDIYGQCDNSTVLPSCPSCMTQTKCEDSSKDCSQYIGQCNNPSYHSLLCNLCRKSCNLCTSCS